MKINAGLVWRLLHDLNAEVPDRLLQECALSFCTTTTRTSTPIVTLLSLMITSIPLNKTTGALCLMLRKLEVQCKARVLLTQPTRACMLLIMKQKIKTIDQNGIAHLAALVVCVLVVGVGFTGWRVWVAMRTDSTRQSSSAAVIATDAPNPKASATASAKPQEPDSADSLESPTKVTSTDEKTYFVYGAPAGQNNKSTKRIIISLPGHGTTADDGYKAWNKHIKGGQYALAEFNWWKGTGEKITDYYQPADVVREVRSFLNKQGYASKDIVILHGFSRGSANTYAVIANDHLQPGPVFDAVISNAGKYQPDFPLTDKALTDAEITRYFKDIPWALACGGKDPNPNRDGCPGMEETKSFLLAHQANVLGIVTDPNAGHGAFHMSDLGLPAQALAMIEKAL